jgi:plastocyanin
MNVCPVCRNVNQRDATACRYCGTTLTPPAPETSAAPAARPRRWPWILGTLALLLVIGVTGFSFLGGGGSGAAAGSAQAIQVGTDAGTALQFAPKSVEASAKTKIALTFNNRATLAHNLTFQNVIGAKTSDQVPAGQSETITFTTPDPGTYTFVCTIHPGMAGQLVVK